MQDVGCQHLFIYFSDSKANLSGAGKQQNYRMLTGNLTTKQSLGTVQSSRIFLLKINATTVQVVHFRI